MPRFELKKSKQVTFFWEIDSPEGATFFTLKFGKVGAGDPEPIVREFPTAFAANKEKTRLIASKKTEGYVEVTFRPAGPRENEKLLAALLENPKDVRAFLVYADWLQSIGDPHGELIAIHAAMAEAKTSDPEKHNMLARQERVILRDHEGEILFGLGAHLESAKLRWRLGFIAGCDVRFGSHDSTDAGKFVEDLLDLRAGKMLRDLTVRVTADAGDVDFDGVISTLESRAPAMLRSLSLLGHSPDIDEEPGYWHRCDVGDVGRLWKALPALKKLAVRGHTVDLGAIGTSRLEELSLDLKEPPAEELRAIAEAKWPKLTSLSLTIGNSPEGDRVTPEAIDRVLGRTPHLTSLAIRNMPETDELVGRIAPTAFSPNLVSLDLSMGALTDAGAEALAASPQLFPKLERIDMSRTTVHLDRGVAAIQRAFPKIEVIADHLREGADGPAERYDDVVE